MDFFQTVYFQNKKKPPEFDATYDPIVSNQKVWKKTPEFDATYDPIVSFQKVCKKLQNLTQHMTL